MTDLRKYLNEIDNAIFRPPGPVSVVQELAALQHVMAAPHSFIRRSKSVHKLGNLCVPFAVEKNQLACSS